MTVWRGKGMGKWRMGFGTATWMEKSLVGAGCGCISMLTPSVCYRDKSLDLASLADFLMT